MTMKSESEPSGTSSPFAPSTETAKATEEMKKQSLAEMLSHQQPSLVSPEASSPVVTPPKISPSPTPAKPPEASSSPASQQTATVKIKTPPPPHTTAATPVAPEIKPPLVPSQHHDPSCLTSAEPSHAITQGTKQSIQQEESEPRGPAVPAASFASSGSAYVAPPQRLGAMPSSTVQHSVAHVAAPISFAPKEPTEPQPRLFQGILGAVKQRLLIEMIDAVKSSFKIIICDKTGAEILNRAFRMHDLMEHDVILVEDILVARQPVLTSPALYFINPGNSESVNALVEDWKGRARYKEAHVFWTSRAQDAVLHRLGKERPLVNAMCSMKDMMLGFKVDETLLFTLEENIELWRLFPSIGRPLLETDHLPSVEKLLEVLHTLDAGMPIIRYHSDSPAAENYARKLLKEADKLKRTKELSYGATDRPIVIIVDRCCDLFEPLVHHRTYQALREELFPLVDGVYNQKYQGRKGESLKRLVIMDELDEYWTSYRHESFHVCLRVFQEELKKLVADHPSLAHGLPKKRVGVEEAGSTLRAIPEFLDKQSKLSAHVDVCTHITQEYAKQQLQAVVDAELDIVLNRRSSTKELLTSIKAVCGDESVPRDVRVRLLVLTCVILTEKELPPEERLTMISSCGLVDEMQPFLNILPQLMSRVFKTGLTSLRKHSRSHGGDASPLPNGEGGLLKKGGSSGSMERPKLLHYQSFARHILEKAIQDTLTKTEFPFVSSEAANAALRQSKKDGQPSSNKYTSLRVKTNIAGGAGENLIDLGFEGRYTLKGHTKVILFVLGGATYGEARVAYELAKEYGREVIVGGSHMVQTKDFLDGLRTLGMEKGFPGKEELWSPSNGKTPASHRGKTTSNVSSSSADSDDAEGIL